MAVKNWHPVQLGIFWLILALFSLPVWVVLVALTDWVAGRYAYRDWFELIPVVLAFLVVFAVASLGLSVTWRWRDLRQTKPQE